MLLISLISVLIASPLAYCYQEEPSSAYEPESLFGVFAEQPIRVPLKDEIVLIHSKEDGWGELPALVCTNGYAYVAYDVRAGFKSLVYLSRVSADLTGSVERVRISGDDEIGFDPSVAVWDEKIWVGWTSYSNGEWKVKICDVIGIAPGRIQVIDGGSSFVSQLRMASGKAGLGCVWSSWEDSLFLIKALFVRSSECKTLTIYAARNPVARPQITCVDDSTWLLVWDEFASEGYVIRMRKLQNGNLNSVETISSGGGRNDWEPSVVSTNGRVLVAWNTVAPGSDMVDIATCIPGFLRLEGCLNNFTGEEVWRVLCTADGYGSNWVAWLTRAGYRRTRLILRRIEREGIGPACEIDFSSAFPSLGFFVNWFDVDMRYSPTIAIETGGSIYLGGFDLLHPSLARIPQVESDHERIGKRREKPPRYTIQYNGETLSVYFGDYHNHTSFSDGRAYPDISANLARFSRHLDFFGTSDHDITLTPGEFYWTKAIAKHLTRQGAFVFVAGYEPSKGWAQSGFGHWNMIYFDGGDVFQFEDGMTPLDLYQYAKENGGILIPHHVAVKFAPHNWDYYDEIAEPVVEICSIHGIFDTYKGKEDDPSLVSGRFVEDGLARGYRFGVVGGSDSHNCFASSHKEFGLTGLFARSLDVEAIREAMVKRRTFAFTGGWIVLDFRCNGRLMGESVSSDEDLVFTCYASSPDSIEQVEIIRNGQSIYSQQFLEPEVRFTHLVAAQDSERYGYYYLRVKTGSGNFGWSSPIWIHPLK